jgi:hypothetical protein
LIQVYIPPLVLTLVTAKQGRQCCLPPLKLKKAATQNVDSGYASLF